MKELLQASHVLIFHHCDPTNLNVVYKFIFTYSLIEWMKTMINVCIIQAQYSQHFAAMIK